MIKELKKTVNMSWSPSEVYPILVATGSAAQQVDATFSNTSHLEIYSLNLGDSSLDLEQKSSLETQHKFHKLVWSGAGVIAGGCDGGLIEFYNVDRLLAGASDALVASSTKHNGHITALDVNPFQNNLLASGASESEIFIWDLNNTSQPMAPGNKSQPYDHVQCVTWNQQVQHILASVFPSRCSVWDLRKNEPIMKLSDGGGRGRWRQAVWHPTVPTQLLTASEDDLCPHLQLWDLRLASSPMAVLEGHSRGVLTVAWSGHEPGMLLSAGKDSRVLLWDPSNAQPGSQFLCELVAGGDDCSQWVWQVSWCPRDAALYASATSNNQLHVHSLLGAANRTQAAAASSSLLSSFGVCGLEPPPAPRPGPGPAAPAAPPAPALPPRAPAWLRRPRAAKFAFGGKLVTFEKCPQGTQRTVKINQVVSDPDIAACATEIDRILSLTESDDPAALEQLADYCREKGDSCTSQNERYIWFFLRANFLPTFRAEALNLLGFKADEIPSKFKPMESSQYSNNVDSLTSGIAGLSRGESTETEAELSTDTSTDLSDAHTLIERKLSNIEELPPADNVQIPNGEDAVSTICRALVCGNLEEAAELCVSAGRHSDALLIAALGSPELQMKVQKYYISSRPSDPVALLAGSLLLSNWDRMLASASANSWRMLLAHILTHCDENASAHYAEMLGDRLSSAEDPSLYTAAAICYLVARGSGALVAAAARAGLTDLHTLALLARRVGGDSAVGDQVTQLESVIESLSSRLAAQGHLHTALRALLGRAAPHAAPLAEPLAARLRGALALAQHADPTPQHAQFASRTRTTSSHSQSRGHYPTQNDTFAPPPPAWSPRPAPPVAAQTTTTGGGISGRSKYKVDPSVQAAPLYGQYSFNNNPNPPQQTFNQFNPPDQYNPAQNYTNSVTQNQPASKQGFGSQNQPGFPGQNQGFPSQNSGFPSQNSGFPSQNSGFPSQNSGFPSQNSGFPSQNSGFPSQNSGFPSQNSGFPSQNHGFDGQNPSLVPLNPLPNQSGPATNPGLNQGSLNNGYYGQQEQMAPAAVPKSVAPGWNDPPMLSSKPKLPQPGEMSALHAGTRRWNIAIEHRRHLDEQKQEVPSQAPITHPLFGAEPPQHIPLNPGQYPDQPQSYPGQQQPPQNYPGQNFQNQGYPGQQLPGQNYPGQQVPGQNFPGHGYPGQNLPGQQQNYGGAPQAYPPKAESPRPAPAPAPKAALAPQLAPLQVALDAIRDDCLLKTNNPQVKRKLEDVQRKLENLYDMLRDYRLSENAIATLHSTVEYAKVGDFESATSTATSLATGPDFASVASFLPGLKVLFQVASQTQHYVR